MDFKGKQITKNYKQIINGTPEETFPLLCPVREHDWLEGWEANMVYSQSGLIEKNCVFTTPAGNGQQAVWQVIDHDPMKHGVEFVKVTPGELIVRITLCLKDNYNGTCTLNIAYQYTALNEAQNHYLMNELNDDFQASMIFWERALNYYIATGKMLQKPVA